MRFRSNQAVPLPGVSARGQASWPGGEPGFPPSRRDGGEPGGENLTHIEAHWGFRTPHPNPRFGRVAKMPRSASGKDA